LRDMSRQSFLSQFACSFACRVPRGLTQHASSRPCLLYQNFTVFSAAFALSVAQRDDSLDPSACCYKCTMRCYLLTCMCRYLPLYYLSRVFAVLSNVVIPTRDRCRLLSKETNRSERFSCISGSDRIGSDRASAVDAMYEYFARDHPDDATRRK
jgi:hypothetical protein